MATMWKPKSLGKVIAEREFVLKRKGRRVGKIRVRFGAPVRNPRSATHDPWWCPVEMTGRDLTCVAGIDSLQALVLALHFAVEHLPIHARMADTQVEWLDQKEKLIFARAFVSSGLEGALLNLLLGTFRAVALLSDRPASIRREGARVQRSLRVIAKELGL
jgi:hypothetical protein